MRESQFTTGDHMAHIKGWGSTFQGFSISFSYASVCKLRIIHISGENAMNNPATTLFLPEAPTESGMMPISDRKLPNELVALIHFVELNKAGWKQRTVDQLILYIIYENQEISATEICEVLRRDFQVVVSLEWVAKRLHELKDQRVLQSKDDDRFELTRPILDALSTQINEADALEYDVRAHFTHIARSNGLDISWSDFRDECLLPLIRESGARTYQMLSGSLDSLPESHRYREYARRFSNTEGVAFDRVIDDFFDGSNPSVRRYILRNLYAYFSIQVLSLEESILDALRESGASRHEMKLFVDTNFLFSILRLHENPSNDAALTLKQLVDDLKNTVSIRMYVLPDTVDEARRTLIHYETRLAHVRVGPNVVEGLYSASVRVSGIAERYLQAARATGHRLSAKEFLSPYIDNFLRYARENGVELYNEDTSDLRLAQKVIDDAHDVQAFEQKKYGDQAKSLEQIVHDVVLWHFVNDRRPPVIEDPIDAGSWVVTVDFRFLGFDAYKRKSQGSLIPVCIHPSSLIQMLHFWIPRSEQSELALVRSLRCMIPRDFDLEAEKITLKILDVVSRFENVDDFSVETLRDIFLNEALRQKLQGEASIEEQIEYVREALVSETAHLREQLGAVTSQKTELERIVKEQANQQLRLQQELSLERVALEATRSEIEQLTKKLESVEVEKFQMLKEIDGLKQELAAVREENERSKQEHNIRRARIRLAVDAIVSFAVGLLLIEPLVQWIVGNYNVQNSMLIRAVLTLVMLLGWSHYIESTSMKDQRLADWKPVQLLRKWRRNAVGLVWWLAQSVVQEYVSRYLSS